MHVSKSAFVLFFNTLFNQMSKKRENEKLQKFTAYLRGFISQNNAIKNHIRLRYGFVIAFETSNKCLVKHFLTTLNNILRWHLYEIDAFYCFVSNKIIKFSWIINFLCRVVICLFFLLLMQCLFDILIFKLVWKGKKNEIH